MRWIFVLHPKCRINSFTCWPAAQKATTVPQLPHGRNTTGNETSDRSPTKGLLFSISFYTANLQLTLFTAICVKFIKLSNHSSIFAATVHLTTYLQQAPMLSLSIPSQTTRVSHWRRAASCRSGGRWRAGSGPGSLWPSPAPSVYTTSHMTHHMIRNHGNTHTDNDNNTTQHHLQYIRTARALLKKRKYWND